MKEQTNVILAIILIIIIAIFAITNTAPVEVSYLFWNAESPLILVILFSVLMGGLIMGAVGMMKIIHLQRENKQMKKVIEKNHLVDDSEKEITNDELRNDENN